MIIQGVLILKHSHNIPDFMQTALYDIELILLSKIMYLFLEDPVHFELNLQNTIDSVKNEKINFIEKLKLKDKK